MNKNTLKLVLLLVVIMIANIAFAQTPPNRTPPPPPGVPVDGGLFILISAAAGLAYKKLKRK